MQVGNTGKAEIIVSEKNTAKTMGSGSLDVFATPALVALMERAAVNGIELPNQQTSVGVSMDIKHLAATPVGIKVWAEAELVEIEGRRLVFYIKAYDGFNLIGEGKHERFIVYSEEFMKKTNRKLQEK